MSQLVITGGLPVIELGRCRARMNEVLSTPAVCSTAHLGMSAFSPAIPYPYHALIGSDRAHPELINDTCVICEVGVRLIERLKFSFQKVPMKSPSNYASVGLATSGVYLGSGLSSIELVR